MTKLIYTGPANSELLEGDETVASGQEFDVSDESRVEELLEHPDIEVARKAFQRSAPSKGTEASLTKSEADSGEGQT